MAVQIPRAGIPQTVQTQPGQAIQDDGGAQDINRVAGQLNQLGQALRTSQAQLDVAEANSRITTAKRLAAAAAAEEGLYGDDYANFMSESVAKARDEVSQLTQLPEVKRQLSNAALQDKEADRLTFEAEGRKLQVVNEQNRIATINDQNRLAAESMYGMDSAGNIKGELIDYMDSSYQAQRSESFLTDAQREEKSRQARSQVGYIGGLEILNGFTKNGTTPDEMAKFLNVLNNPEHEYTSRMTAEDVFKLKRLAEQGLVKDASRRSALDEQHTNRLKTLNEKAERLLAENGTVSRDFIANMRREYQRVGSIWDVEAGYAQYPEDWRIDPSKQERARQIQNDTLSILAKVDMQASMNFMPRWKREVTKTAVGQQLKDKGIDVQTGKKYDAETGKIVDTGEGEELLAQYQAAEASVKAINTSSRNGTLTIDYVENFGRGAQDLRAAQTIEDFESPAALDAFVARAQASGPASQHAGMAATLFTNEEAKQFAEQVKRGDVSPQTTMMYASVMADMDATQVQTGMDAQGNPIMEWVSPAKETIDRMGKNNQWMTGMVFAIQQDNTVLAEKIAAGVTFQAQELDKGTFYAAEGDEKAVDDYIRSLYSATFESDPGIANDLFQSTKMAWLGTKRGSSGNSLDEDEIGTVVNEMFINGADIIDGKIYPKPKLASGEDKNIFDFTWAVEADWFDGDIFPDVYLEDIVSDEFAGMTGKERLAEEIESATTSSFYFSKPSMAGLNDVEFEPDPSEPGVYYLRVNNINTYGALDSSGYLLDKNTGAPAKFNFNGIDQRIQDKMSREVLMTEEAQQRSR